MLAVQGDGKRSGGLHDRVSHRPIPKGTPGTGGPCRSHGRRLIATLLLVGWLVVDVPLVSAQSSPIQYAYDAVGRLVVVVDADGNAALYVYDAVGNLLRIDRTNAADLPGAVGITAVVPGQGQTGAAGRIFRKGFRGT